MKNKNKTYLMSTQRLISWLNWAYNYGKNDGGESSFRRERDEKLEGLK